MTWHPAAHSAATDYQATAVVFDDEHKPLAYEMSDADLANAAAARYHIRAHVARLNAMPTKSPTKVVDKP